jgi:hypothetical protein
MKIILLTDKKGFQKAEMFPVFPTTINFDVNDQVRFVTDGDVPTLPPLVKTTRIIFQATGQIQDFGGQQLMIYREI